MIPPRNQWCIQIDVTNACTRKCSNCTRMLAHVKKPFFMSPETFRQACQSLADFPEKSGPDPYGRDRKVVGMIGGEPLLHPDFPELARIMAEEIPNVRARGLWTGLDWRSHKHAKVVEEFFPPHVAYLNHNMHNPPSLHQPILVAVQDVIPDKKQMWETIRKCPLQEMWSGTITPKGFFFCEVAGAFDMVFHGPGGKPIEPGCWDKPLAHYKDQMEFACPRCGVCVPMVQWARRDDEEVDDCSASNLLPLSLAGSLRVSRVHSRNAEDYNPVEQSKGWEPLNYKRIPQWRP